MSNVFVYIDESGTLGLKKSKNEPYFIITALVLNEKQVKTFERIITRVFRKISCKKELHGSEMSFEEKNIFYNKIKNKEFEIQYHVSHKESIKKELLKKTHTCFNYFVFQMLENKMNDSNITKLEILVDNRNVKVDFSHELEKYLQNKIKKEIKDLGDKISVRYVDSVNSKHIQMVDVISNGIYAEYNYGKNYFYKKIENKIKHKELFPRKHFNSQ
jgi:HD-GYP domain-containing protein (c-di-GMP phosphodiesterase class II)